MDELNASPSYSSSREVLGIAVRSGETLDHKNDDVELEEEGIEKLEEEKPHKPKETPSIPYPQALQGPGRPSQDDLSNPLIKSHQETNISVPLIEALKYILAYQNFVKDIV